MITADITVRKFFEHELHEMVLELTATYYTHSRKFFGLLRVSEPACEKEHPPFKVRTTISRLEWMHRGQHRVAGLQAEKLKVLWFEYARHQAAKSAIAFSV